MGMIYTVAENRPGGYPPNPPHGRCIWGSFQL